MNVTSFILKAASSLVMIDAITEKSFSMTCHIEIVRVVLFGPWIDIETKLFNIDSSFKLQMGLLTESTIDNHLSLVLN